MTIKRNILRYLFIGLTFLGSFSTYPKAIPAVHADEPPEGDIIEISTPEDFQNINNDLTAHYEIVNDIDFEGIELTQLASLSFQPFEGVLNGNGHRLKNLLIPSTFRETFVGTYISRTFNHSLFKENNGVISNLTFENVSFESSIVATSANYSFSVVAYNNGTLRDLNIHWSENSFNFQGSTSELKFSLVTIENRGNIQRVVIDSSAISFWGSVSHSTINISGVAIYNSGLIEEVFLSLNSTVSLSSNYHTLYFSGAIFENHSSGILRNLYLNTNVTFSLFIWDISNAVYTGLKLSGIVHYNYGLVEFFYNTGVFNIVFPMDFIFDRYRIELNRSIYADTSIETYGTPGVSLNGFTDLFFRFLTLSKEPLLTSLNHISRKFPNSFSFSNSINMTKDTIEFGHIDEAFHDLYIFVAETGTLADDYTSPFVNDIDLYSFNLDHFLIVEEFVDNSSSGLTSLSPLELSRQFLTNEAWSDSQLSDINAFVLSFVTTLPFDLSNYSIEPIGTSYTISEEIKVTLNGIELEPGTHFLNDPGTYSFALQDRLFDITNSVSLVVYSESTLLPEGTYIGSFTPNLDAGTIAKLNGQPYVINTEINTPGENTLVIFGENGHEIEYSFTIQLVLTSLSNNNFYNNAVSPSFSGGTATLNGIPYLSNTLIESVGNHELIIYGINDFIEIIRFTILPNKGDLEDGQIYPSGYAPILIGQELSLTLNGEDYSSGTPIILAGSYELILTGINNYEEIIEFTISINFLNSIENNGNYILEVTPIFEGGYATLNGQPFISGTNVHEVGHHTLQIFGLNNDLVETINFTIIEKLINPTNGGLFLYTPIIEGGSSYELNGEPYTINTPISTPGNYTLRVFGLNGYHSDHQFEIDLDVKGLESRITTTNLNPTFSGGTATLNGIPFYSGDTIVEIGNYELVVQGVGAFRQSYTFSIIPSIELIDHNGEYTEFVIPKITGEGMTISFNGNLISNINVRITNPGQNTIIIRGTGNYEEIISFEIIPLIEAPANNAQIINQTTLLSWSGGVATVNGQLVVSNSVSLSNIGIYNFVLTGVGNNYIFERSFTIEPRIESLFDGETYSGSVSPTITAPGATVLLNDEIFSNTLISDPGVHNLRISGINGYVKTLTFTVTLVVTGIPPQNTITNSVVRINFSGGGATLNGESYSSNDAIATIGDYTLIITGVNGFTEGFEFSILPLVQSLVNGTTYEGSVLPTIFANGASLTLNGERYEGTTINSPGNHVLLIEGVGGYTLEIEFTVNLILTGLANNATYVNRITIISFSGGSALLNDLPIVTGHRTQDVGHHVLIITGVNGFSRTYRFTNHASVNFETQSNDQYDGSFLPVIRGENISLTLNGDVYNEERITLPGTHSLSILSPIGGYVRTYTFTINLLVNGIEDTGVYTDITTPLFSGGDLYLNGNPYRNGSPIYSTGEYTLTLYGVGDFEETYRFTILPYIVSMPTSNSTQTAFNFEIEALHSYTTVTLNGVPYTSSTSLTEIGHYHVVIMFRNNILVDQSFTIEPDDYIEDGSTFDSPFILDYPNGDVYINGNLKTNAYRFDQQGTYQIEIKGVGEYSHSFTLVFNNPNLNQTFNLLLPLALSLTFPLLTYGLRRKRIQ